MFAATKLIATIPVFDEDANADTTIHVGFPDRDAYDGFIAAMTADDLDCSSVTLSEVPSTWECDGRDDCMVAA